MNIKVYDVRKHPGDSSFLIDNGETSILYDSGFGFTGDEVCGNIKNILKDRKLDYIFLSHSHYDHVLGSANVLKKYPDAKVVAGEYAATIFKKDSAKKIMRDLDVKFAEKCGFGEYPDLTCMLKVDIPVKDNDVIKTGDLNFIILNLPGHTKCSIGFYCEEYKLLLSSETIGVYNGCDGVVPSYLVGYDMALKSIDRVLKLDIDKILVPHFGLLTGEDTKKYLYSAKKNAIEFAENVYGLIKQDKNDEEIFNYFTNKYYHGYIKSIYPKDAMKLNTSIMIKLLRRELFEK